MSISKQIEEIFAKGVQKIEIGVPPKQPGSPSFFAGAQQWIPVGEPGNQIMAQQQAVGETVTECLERLSSQVSDAWELKKDASSIVKMGNGR